MQTVAVTNLSTTFFAKCNAWFLPRLQVLESASFRKSMLEKLIWISAFMLVGAKNPGATVGDVESKYRDEVRSAASAFLRPKFVVMRTCCELGQS
jgi:hypothetical protein